jgi:hypothetical protein
MKPVKMPRKSFIAEHEDLVKVLKRGNKRARQREAKEQAQELTEIKNDKP